MKDLIFISILLVCVCPIVKAEEGVGKDSVATLYDFAFFADDGNIVISQIDSVDDGDYWIPQKWGMIDTSGNVIVDGKTTWLIPSYNDFGYMLFPNPAGYTIFMREGSPLYGIFDKDYKEQIPPTYTELTLFGDYAVGKDGAKPGKVIIHIPSKKIVGHVKDTYDVADVSEGTIFAAGKTTDTKGNDDPGKWEYYILDLKGNVVVSSDMIGGCTVISGFKDGRAAILTDEGKLGFIDKKGNIAIAPDYDYDEEFFYLWDQEFHNGRAVLTKDGKSGVVDKNGKVVIPFDCDFVDRDSNSGDENFKVRYNSEDEDFFLFDNNGKKIGKYIPTVSDNPDQWSIFRDEATERGGYTDSEGKLMLPPIYHYPSYFSNGYALVGIDNEGICLIDSKGRILIKRLARRNQAMLPG